MKIKELVERVKQTHPAALGSLPDGKINLLTRTLFGLIREELENTTEGSMKIAFLGQFKVRYVETEKDGEKVQHRRIQFVPAVARAAAEGDDAEAADAEAGELAESPESDVDADADAALAFETDAPAPLALPAGAH